MSPYMYLVYVAMEDEDGEDLQPEVLAGPELIWGTGQDTVRDQLLLDHAEAIKKGGFSAEEVVVLVRPF